MSHNSPYMHPAKLVSYDKANRTAKVTIAGLTDGVSEGITAMLAYPIGDDDLDTERELIQDADVWVFFEQGDTSMPVIVFYRRHGKGQAVIDVRRIRQENIEVLARASITLTARDFIDVKANKINLEADEVNITANEVNIKSDVSQIGDYFMTGDKTINGSQTINGNSVSYGNQTTYGSMMATVDLMAGNISVRYHYHGNVENGGGSTSPSKN